MIQKKWERSGAAAGLAPRPNKRDGLGLLEPRSTDSKGEERTKRREDHQCLAKGAQEPPAASNDVGWKT